MWQPNAAIHRCVATRRGLRWLLVASLLGALPAAGAPVATAASIEGTLARREALRAEPLDDARAILNLEQGARVRVLFREGPWYRVDRGGQQGWIRLYWVRTGGQVAAPAAGQARQSRPRLSIAQAATQRRARRDQGQVTASLGVRGLSEDELKGAHFNAAQMAKLDTLAVDAAAATAFAAAGPLSGRHVDEIGAAGSRSR